MGVGVRNLRPRMGGRPMSQCRATQRLPSREIEDDSRERFGLTLRETRVTTEVMPRRLRGSVTLPRRRVLVRRLPLNG